MSSDHVVTGVAEPTPIAGLHRVRAKSVTDSRGTVREFYRASAMRSLGAGASSGWAQINVTHTEYGSIRGLHGEATDKLVGVASGTAFGVYLDARPDSPTFGRVITVNLAEGAQMYVPRGVCNGFQATSHGGCEYVYCFSVEWSAELTATSVCPLDPALGIRWPVPLTSLRPGQVSEKDRNAPTLAEVAARTRLAGMSPACG